MAAHRDGRQYNKQQYFFRVLHLNLCR
jgi:hypothetical protein